MKQKNHPSPKITADDYDPGIRAVVKLLQSRGWNTTDSGDGESKFDPESPYFAPDGAIPFPHVVVRLQEGDHLLERTLKLQSLLSSFDQDWNVELVWRPMDNIALVFCWLEKGAAEARFLEQFPGALGGDESAL